MLCLQALAFEIDGFSRLPDGRVRLDAPEDFNSYWRLLSGPAGGHVQTPLMLSLTNRLITPQPATNANGFLRLQRVPLSAPLDTDGDGLNDVYELRSDVGLDPLNPADATYDSDADGRPNLEEFKAGTDPRIPDVGFEFPNLMAEPPEVTGSHADAPSSIPGSILVPPGDARFHYANGRVKPMPSHPAFVQRDSFGITNSGYPISILDNNSLPFAVEFSTTAADLEALEYGWRAGYRYAVNGALVDRFDFVPALPEDQSEDGRTYLRRLHFGGLSGFQEPAWIAAQGVETVDGPIHWKATALPPDSYVINDSSWSGADGVNPPTSWKRFNAPSYQVADHDGQTSALNIVAPGVGANTYQLVLNTGTAYFLRFRIKVIAGSWSVTGTGTNLTPALTTQNSGAWHTVQRAFVAPGPLINIAPITAGEAWVDDFQVFEQSAAPEGGTPWASRHRYFRGDEVQPVIPNGFLYRAVVVCPEQKNVRIDFSGYSGFGGVRLPPDDALLAPAGPSRPKCVVLGDSYAVGAGASYIAGAGVVPEGYLGPSNATAYYRGWAATLCRLLDWDCWPVASSRSGYLSQGWGGRFAERLASGVLDEAPDYLIIAGGFNDASFAPSAVRDEFTNLVSTIRAALPLTHIIVIGPWYYQVSASEPKVAVIGINEALRDAASALDLPFVNVIDSGWISGDWRVPHSGNANLLFDYEGVHPNSLGHEYLGLHIAAEVKRLLAGEPAPDEWTVLLNTPLWTGVNDTTPPDGWGKAGTVSFTLADHLGVTQALNVRCPNATGNNLFKSAVLPPRSYGYQWRQVRYTFKLRVVSGSVVPATFQPTAIPGKPNRRISTRSRLVGENQWVLFPDNSPLGTLILGPRTFANCGAWTEYEIVMNAMQPGLAFFSQPTTDPETSYWLKDVTVELREF
jgi:lysophospholipase L1-like esterase